MEICFQRCSRWRIIGFSELGAITDRAAGMRILADDVTDSVNKAGSAKVGHDQPGTWTRWARTVAVAALARKVPGRAPTARTRLRAMAHRVSQAASAWNRRTAGGQGGYRGRPSAAITGLRIRTQYSPLITKKEPRITLASFDFWRANLKRDASSPGTSMPSESLNPTARFSPSLMPYITLTDRPDS